MQPRATKSRARAFVALATTVLLVVIVGWTWSHLADPLHDKTRRAWKNNAIATIESQLSDTEAIRTHINRISAIASTRPSLWEPHSDILVMKNGEWIVCQSACTKEKTKNLRKDLFIGRASDGKWYYSTFHFCINKCVLTFEDQPRTLAEFIDGYWLVEFDGKSDACLELTWDGGPWGEGKLQSQRNSTQPAATISQ